MEVQMALDPEIQAMSDVASALSSLDDDTIRRVIRWAAERYKMKAVASSASGVADPVAGGAPVRHKFDDFAALFDAANPQTGPDKVLVAGYWFQVNLGQEDFDSFPLNKELKHLGHASENITRDLDALVNRTPRLVIQIRKSGTTRQARKRYKLTLEGERAVDRLLSATGSQVAADV